MPEPNLAADAPVAQVVYPMKINFLEVIGQNFYLPARDRLAHEIFERLASARCNGSVHVDEPLELGQRLNDAARALGRRDILHDVLLCDEKSFLFEPVEDDLARLEHFFAVEAP